MGCDIHVMTECRLSVKGEKRWINCDNWRYNRYYGDENERMMELVEIYGSRNYELFSFLADVRNYGKNPSFGFDRGFPDDASFATAQEYEAWGMDAHTPGYATLSELKEKISKVKKVRYEGAVLKEQAERYRNTGETPDAFCQGVGAWVGIAPRYQDIYEWLVWEEKPYCFDQLMEAIEDRKRDVFYKYCPESDDGSHDSDIRIVFWFDN